MGIVQGSGHNSVRAIELCRRGDLWVVASYEGGFLKSQKSFMARASALSYYESVLKLVCSEEIR